MGVIEDFWEAELEWLNAEFADEEEAAEAVVVDGGFRPMAGATGTFRGS